MSENSVNNQSKGGKRMAVSMAIIPTLKGDAATSVLRTLESSKIKPYSAQAKSEAERKIRAIMQEKTNK